MVQNRRLMSSLVQTTAVVVALGAMVTTAVINPVSEPVSVAVVTTSEEVTAQAGRTAGIVTVLSADTTEAIATAIVETSEVTAVAASATEDAWANKLMATVNDYLYVREAADSESAVSGKLRKGDLAEIVASLDGWYQISSGNLTGYVSADYSVTGAEAYALAESICDTYATATTGGVRVRSEATEDASILKALGEGDRIEVATDAEAPEGWVAVLYSGQTAYVSADYVEVELDTSTGITSEEEAEAAAKAAQTTTTTTVQNEAVASSYDDETLLAALIQCEAGRECYEGQVAVGAVVVNRLRSGGYPGSIYDVIYQSGQFSPARSGSVARVAAAGPSGTARQAAQAALAGTDNTSGATHFKRASSGHAGVVIGNHVFF